jgi:uncharacterized membrane protein YbhN (UPF0104 family)
MTASCVREALPVRRAVIWGGQALLAALVVVFVVRSVVANWASWGNLGELDLELRLRPGWALLAAATVWATYGLLIEAWRRVLSGWGQRLSFPPATRVWCLSNLGRYLPGKVWSIAGLALLAQKEGVSGWAAAGSALAMQAIALGTGAVVVAVGGAGEVSPYVLGAAIAFALVAIVLLVWQPLAATVVRLVRPSLEWRALPSSAAAAASTATLLSWLAYGIAFWFLGYALFGPTDLTIVRAIGVFAAGYILGLLALFAPGGVGMREVVFIALLGPTIGGDGALALAIASRLLLTGTEVTAALVALWLGHGKESSIERHA